MTVSAPSLKQKMERQHGGSVTQMREVRVGGVEPTTYLVSSPLVLKTEKCPMTGCPEVARSAVQLWKLFMY